MIPTIQFRASWGGAGATRVAMSACVNMPGQVFGYCLFLSKPWRSGGAYRGAYTAGTWNSLRRPTDFYMWFNY